MASSGAAGSIRRRTCVSLASGHNGCCCTGSPDPGPGFSLDNLSHAAGADGASAIAHDQVRQAQGLRPGGFGLTMIRAIADELLYNEQRNEVLFVKYLDEPRQGE